MEDKEKVQNGEDSKNNSEKPKKKRKDRRIEREYFDFIEIIDPSTGLTIKQKVKITKYKTKGSMNKKSPAITEDDIGYEPAMEEGD